MALSLVMLLLAGLIDLAPALTNAGQVSQAVREGVDYGHMRPSDLPGIRARVRNAAPLLTLADGDITANCFLITSTTVRLCSAAVVGDTITVTATAIYVPKINMIAQIVGGSIALTRSATSLIY